MSIDLDFRPAHYGDFDDPVALAVNGIKGQMRREMVRDMLEAEGEQRERYDAVLGPLEEDVLEESAPEAFTRGITSLFGPSWMGGEYLPDMRAGEVEIARVVLASATMDVTSVRARWRGGRYHYTIVDEYQKEYWVRPRTSRRPLTLAQLIRMIDEAEGEDLELSGHPFVEAWWWQQHESGYPLEECTAFAWVESDLYPDLGRWYEERAEAWREEREGEGWEEKEDYQAE